MNLRQLEAFVWVARLKSFRGAAAQLNATQPAISLRIQGLERELGTRVFDRMRGRVSLTAAGKECIDLAEQIGLLASQLGATCHRRGMLGGRVSLGVSELIAHTWLPALIALMDHRYPEVKIDATIDMTPPLVRGLESGDYDVILAGAHRFATTFPTLDLGSESFVWIARADYQIGRRPLRPRDLQGQHVITWGKEAAIFQSIEKWFIEDGSYPTHRITCNTAATMARLVSAGLGISLLPSVLVEEQLNKGDLCIIPTVPDFEPVKYRAIYVSAPDSLGQLVAEAAREVSSFEVARHRRNLRRGR